MWNDSVITNAGAALLAQSAGGGTLIIDGAKAGTATVPAVNLAAQTALSGTVHDLLIARSVDVEAGRNITVQIRPESAAYTIKQIGLFAHVGDGDETLLAIYQDSTGINIPDNASMPDYISNFFAMVTISNTLEVSVTIDTSAAVSAGDLEAGLATKQDKIDSSHKLPYSLLSGTPTIPAAVTEQTVAGWGFTKNTGTYTKPSSGIPKTDLASAVQTSLGKADAAATVTIYTATISASSWTGSAAPFYKNVTISGITANDTPIIDIVQTGIEDTDRTMRVDWRKITRITTSSNSIRVYADEKPSAKIQIQLQVVRR